MSSSSLWTGPQVNIFIYHKDLHWLTQGRQQEASEANELSLIRKKGDTMLGLEHSLEPPPS